MPDPNDLADFRRHAEWALLAATAQELGLFEALADEPSTADALAGACELSRRGVEILLGALEDFGFVERNEDSYRLSDAGRAMFVQRGSDAFQGDAVRHWLGGIRNWAMNLGDAVRRGGPPERPEAPGTGGTSDPDALARFMATMDSKPAALVEAVVEGCLARVPHARSMLDLGGGPGTFARAFAERGLMATLFDRPEVIDHVAEAYGLAAVPKLRLARGDFLASPPERKWDIVLLANITHIYDAETNAMLLQSMARCVRTGGALAVLDFVRGRSPFAPLFAITMLLGTEQGDTYRLADYTRWMEDAGLRDVRCRSVDTDRQLVTAVRSK